MENGNNIESFSYDPILITFTVSSISPTSTLGGGVLTGHPKAVNLEETLGEG